jgi:hypothetical protein
MKHVLLQRWPSKDAKTATVMAITFAKPISAHVLDVAYMQDMLITARKNRALFHIS